MTIKIARGFVLVPFIALQRATAAFRDKDNVPLGALGVDLSNTRSRVYAVRRVQNRCHRRPPRK